MAITYAVGLSAAAETPGAADIACRDATIEPTNDNPAHLGALPAPASTHINSSLSRLIHVCFESIVDDESDDDADGENSFPMNEQSAAASTCPAPSPGEAPMLMCGHLRI